MEGTDVTIYADSFSFVNAAYTTSTLFSLSLTGGELGATTTSGTIFAVRGGFQGAERGILTYTVSPSTITLGPMTYAGGVSSAGTIITVSTDSETGYSVSLTEDGNLRSGGNDINDVSDGEVTAGSEEYGIRASGDDALISGSADRAISGAMLLASSAGEVSSRQTTVEFRAAVDAQTPLGTYGHGITFTVTVNP